MGKKNKNNDGDKVVFSTNPEFALEGLGDLLSQSDDNMKGKQDFRIWLDRKQRRGKAVTLIKGYKGNPQTLKEIAKLLKTKCGVGGAVKDGDILIQGDHRKKVLEILQNEGYNAKLAGG